MNNTKRILTPVGHKAIMLMRDAGIPHQSREQSDYLWAVDVILAQKWETPEDEAQALQEASHWVGR